MKFTKKSRLIPRAAGLGLIISLSAIDYGGVFAATVGFNNIPDGTPVSAGNPYAGILNIQAEAAFLVSDTQNFNQVWTESFIQDGALEVISHQSHSDGDYYSSTV
jgi:hypothetical protein